MYDVGRWLSGRVSALHSVVACSISSGGDHGIVLRRPNKVETAVQWFCMSRASVYRIFWSWWFNIYSSSWKCTQSSLNFAHSQNVNHVTSSCFTSTTATLWPSFINAMGRYCLAGWSPKRPNCFFVFLLSDASLKVKKNFLKGQWLYSACWNRNSLSMAVISSRVSITKRKFGYFYLVFPRVREEDFSVHVCYLFLLKKISSVYCSFRTVPIRMLYRGRWKVLKTTTGLNFAFLKTFGFFVLFFLFFFCFFFVFFMSSKI